MPNTECVDQSEHLPRVENTRLDTPIFFMHIAKTAGSYLNRRFEVLLGPQYCATHIELSIGNRTDLKAALDRGVTFFSGHVMLGLWNDIAGDLAPKFQMATILRDPIEHLASHIQWLDHYNRPDKRREYLALDEAHRRVVDKIGASDIGEIGQLDDFLTNLSGIETRLFDNCQARYFLMSGQRDVVSQRALSLGDRRHVSAALKRFDYVIRQDDLKNGLALLSKGTGIDLSFSDTRINAAKSLRKIDTSNLIVRQILGKRTLLDQWLWRRVHSLDAGRALGQIS